MSEADAERAEQQRRKDAFDRKSRVPWIETKNPEAIALQAIAEQLRLGNEKLERIAATLERAHPAAPSNDHLCLDIVNGRVCNRDRYHNGRHRNEVGEEWG